MPSNESFDQLVKELTTEVAAKVKEQVQASINSVVSQRVSELVTADTVAKFIVNRIDQRIHEFMPDTSVFEKKVASLSDDLSNNLYKKAQQIVDTSVKVMLNNVDVRAIAGEQIAAFLKSTTTNKVFPDNYIPAAAINREGLILSGNNINGGIIKNFASVGIDDKANTCKMTILDQAVVFEETVHAPKLEVKGNAIVEGDLEVRGTFVETSLAFQDLVKNSAAMVKQLVGPEIIQNFEISVFERIKTEGIEVEKLRVNGESLVDGRKLSYAVTDSNLQKVGIIRDLQTQGENLFCDTLYVTKNRIGVNTMEPSAAFSLWDEEIELTISKQKQNTAKITAQRNNSLVLGSSNQDNLICTPDGKVTVNQLQIGTVSISSSHTPPSYEAVAGTIVINANPNLGGPVGWVSLGHARWANFGLID